MADCTTLSIQVARFFEEKMNLEVSSMVTDLVDTGLLDSLALMNVLLHLEQEFGVEISIDDLEIDNFRSIATIAEFIKRKATAG